MAIDAELVSSLRTSLSSPDQIRGNGFQILQGLCCVLGSHEDEAVAQELILRALENKASFAENQPILDALVREIGLFPYLDPRKMTVADQIAYEVHRPSNLDQETVFHARQAVVYRAIVSGRNVVLNAPTSFGKSLITDAVIATGKFKNVLVVVPTIALIDETRRRLFSRFKDKFKIITHSFQQPSERNVFVLTQERALELKNWEQLEFVVIDEFYKLDPRTIEDERSSKLNEVFLRVLRYKKQFYLLGPNIGGVTESLRKRADFLLFSEEFRTVVSDSMRIDPGDDRIAALVELCKSIREPTIIFCSSPAVATNVAKELVERNLNLQSEVNAEAADWVAENYHDDWTFTRALRNGIGLHHGRIPRSLNQYIVNSFDQNEIRFLICTSTLIEGVNTKAKNVILFSNTIMNRRLDFFTFNNIRGRSGRMFQHFIGNVYLFEDSPDPDLPVVDMPGVSQSAKASNALLMQIEDAELSPASRERMRPFHAQSLVTFETLRANDLDPVQQLNLARDISENVSRYAPFLQWKGFPRYEQLEVVCDLIWNHFEGDKRANGSVSSAKQLAYLLTYVSINRPNVRQLVENQNKVPFTRPVDIAVERVLDFLRIWAHIHFPRYLRVVDRIQREVLTKAHLEPGNFDSYASNVENLFLDATYMALDEYGIPVEVSKKIHHLLRPEGNLDDVLDRLRELNANRTPLSSFEKKLVRTTQKTLQ